MTSENPRGKWLRKERPKWVPKVDWSGIRRPILFPPKKDEASGPPWGHGHFDRYYFTNCTLSVDVLEAVALIRDATTGQTVELLVMGPVPPLQVGVMAIEGESFPSRLLEIAVKFQDAGEMYVAHYPVSLDDAAMDEMALPHTNETIVCAVIGLSLLHRGSSEPEPYIEPYGVIYGSDGTQFPVNPENISIAPFVP